MLSAIRNLHTLIYNQPNFVTGPEPFMRIQEDRLIVVKHAALAQRILKHRMFSVGHASRSTRMLLGPSILDLDGLAHQRTKTVVNLFLTRDRIRSLRTVLIS